MINKAILNGIFHAWSAFRAAFDNAQSPIARIRVDLWSHKNCQSRTFAGRVALEVLCGIIKRKAFIGLTCFPKGYMSAERIVHPGNLIFSSATSVTNMDAKVCQARTGRDEDSVLI